MLNEPVKGKINDFEQFLKLLEFLGDDVLFKLKCGNDHILFCSEHGEFTTISNGAPITAQDLKKKLSKWVIMEKKEITFTIIPAIDKCPDGEKISKNDLINIIESIKYIRQIPARFKIKILNDEKVPSILKRFSRHPVERELILNSSSFSLLDLCKWEKEGAIKLEKINLMDRIAPLFAGIAFVFIAATAVISFFPFGRTIVTYVKLQELENEINCKRILNYRIPEILPVKDAFLNRIYYKNGKLISPGPDRRIGTKDDIVLKLPDLKGSSLFVIP
ncbi:hypothetical protein [Desulfurobacterium indicum]|uniref:Uncharacterized protein n=1 Tax=Desulfurobacterium indicum TaxID=1914305 RepID=A0A1R1ML03_9BACT|nr:hypothetical protein [Desulfurobacterium indicum]OMH40446.1 hypothetical protein BLW93_05130 [Desulfurobacterium indicum]